MDCLICLEQANYNAGLFCNNCKKLCCIPCLLMYEKTICAGCNTAYSDYAIKKTFNKKILDVYATTYVVNNLLKIDNDELTQYLNTIENKKNLRFGINNKIKKEENKYILKCKKCKGFVNDKYECVLCLSNYCGDCEEIKEINHKCDKIILENLNFLKKEKSIYKRCIGCFTYIQKTFGCNDMQCTNCGMLFNWRSLEMQHKTSNFHYKIIYNKDIRIDKLEIPLVNEEVNDTFLPINGKYIIEPITLHFFNEVNKKLNINKKKAKEWQFKYTIYVKETPQNQINNKMYYKKLYKYIKAVEYYENIKQRLLLWTELSQEHHEKEEWQIIEHILNEIHDLYIIPHDICYTIDNNNFRKKRAKNETKLQYIESVKESAEPVVDEACTVTVQQIECLNQLQEAHFQSVVEILKKHKVLLNTSYAGSGKTYITIKTAHELKVKKLFIICPGIITKKWEEVINKYNDYYKFEFIIVSYGQLLLKGNRNINNFLKKTINYKYHQGKNTQIEVLPNLINFFNKPSMLIIDESHIGKNKSLLYDTILAISQVAKEKNAYIVNITATPVETNLQIKLLCKKIQLFNSGDDEELNMKVAACEFLIKNVKEDEKIEPMNKISTLDIPLSMLSEIVAGVSKTEIFKRLKIQNDTRISSELMCKRDEDLIKIAIMLVKKNYTYENILFIFRQYNTFIFKKCLKIITYAVRKMNEFTYFRLHLNLNKEKETKLNLAFNRIDFNQYKECFSIIYKGMIQIETLYVDNIINIVKKINETANAKIVIGLNFNDVIYEVYSKIYAFESRTKILNGTVRLSEKNKIINAFQENNANIKILIINIACVNTGVDLDDKNGNWPRHVLIIPNFNYTDIYQFIHRFYRENSKSKPMINIIDNSIKIISKLTYKSLIHENLSKDIDKFNNLEIIEEEQLIEKFNIFKN